MGDSEIRAQAVADTITPEEIRSLTKEGELTAVLEMVLRDEHGNVVDRRVQKSESFLRQFLDLLNAMMYGSSPLSADNMCVTIWGGYTSLTQQYQNLNVMAGTGNAYWGICVGAGTNVPTITDYTLQAWIAHGTGSGQLQYGAMTSVAPASDSVSSSFTLTRVFSNGSGASITVNEVGLIAGNTDGSNNYDYELIIRDVISGGYVVPNGQQLTLNYRIICNV